jgi:EmrB/QacA subfamily drug resistance transporter
MKNQAGGGGNKGAALFVAVGASFLTPFIGSSVSVALPTIDKEFGLDAITLGWVVTAYLLAAAIFLVPFGRLADIKGRKRVFTYGIIIDAAASICAALAPSGTLLIASRVLQGLGGAMIFGTGVAIVTSIFPLSERGKALGINAAAVYIGLSLGPPASGLLTQYLGWRSIFALDALIGLIIIVAVFWKLKGEWAGAKGEKFDAIGSLIYGVTLLAIMYGFTLLPDPWGMGLVGAGAIGLVAFVLWENRVESPVLHMDLFKRSTVFSMSNVAALINYSATYAIGFLLSLYLQYIKGFTPEITGLILILQPVMMAALSPVAGRLSDRIEPGLIASVGMALTTVGLVMLTFLDQNTQLPLIMSGLVVVGIGFGLFSSPNTNAIMSSVGKSFYGVASGTLATMRLVGQMLSLGIVMIMFALFIGQVQITPGNYPAFLMSYRIAFIVFAVLCFGGIFASMARGKSRGTVPMESSNSKNSGDAS